MSSASTRLPLSSAIFIFRVSMSVSKLLISPFAPSISPVSSALESVQICVAFSISDWVSDFLPSNSVLSFSSSVMMPSEWNLYSGLSGSTRRPCMNARTSRRFGASTRLMASAMASVLPTSSRRVLLDCSSDAPPPFEARTACRALSRELQALVRSAISASNSAASFRHEATILSNSVDNSSISFFFACSSVFFPATVAVSSAMPAERVSIVS
mmetsp:Transcript_102015/g.266195  ORF Transcript_102015/g.266195 Transcript_102015/m.266195 type:complete len:213 (-) Transcript_102015:345-983(-)